MRSNIVYGFSAGAIVGAVIGIGVLLINVGAPRLENIPPDAPQQGMASPVTRDTFSTGTHTTGVKSSAPVAKDSPAPVKHHHKKHITSGGGTKSGTGTATNAPRPMPSNPTIPSSKPSSPVVLPVPLPSLPPLLPGVKVTVPPLLGVSTGG